MSNVSRPSRPARPSSPKQADTSRSADSSTDPLAQLRQLRESLRRDAQEAPDPSGDATTLSKKELAARRFAGTAGAQAQKGTERGNAPREAVGTGAQKQASVVAGVRSQATQDSPKAQVARTPRQSMQAQTAPMSRPVHSGDASQRQPAPAPAERARESQATRPPRPGREEAQRDSGERTPHAPQPPAARTDRPETGRLGETKSVAPRGERRGAVSSAEAGRVGEQRRTRHTGEGEGANSREARQARPFRDSGSIAEPREPRQARESREGAEPRDPRQTREPLEGAGSREPRQARESREGAEPRESRQAHETRETADPRHSRKPLETAGSREAQQARESRKGAETREPRQAREFRAAAEPRESREGVETRESRPAHEAREGADPREPRQARELRNAAEQREPRQARESREAAESRGPRQAREGADPRDPRQTREPLEAAEPHKALQADEPREGAAPREPRQARATRAAGDPREPRAPRPPRPPRVITPNPVPPITFPEALPVSGRREEIARAIAGHQVVIVSGETGSGKTTQLPKICLALGRGLGAGGSGLIGHTQPRRIAASATGRRIAEELGTPFGQVVGYKVRFTDNLAPGASVKLMTDGILLAETQTDPLLTAYDTIIIDEAHERSLNIDFLLGYLKEILPKRPDLKLIVTSATIDAQRFARHFGSDEHPAPVIEVSGRLYPVEVRYRPIEEDSVAVKSAQGTLPKRGERNDRKSDRDLMEAIVDAVDELCRVGSGDVLVFLPGEREIRDAAEALRKHHPPHTEILPLFARLSAQEQERVFRPSNARRIVLATNVAETSLTVPGIRYVVDTGMARVKRYSYRNKVEQLQIEPVSQAAANQRAGRCGRVADGVCIRLYDEADFQMRPRFTDPEILRSSLAAVILRMKSLHLTAIETFPFIEPPPGRAIADGYQLLNELGAVDDDNALTPLGRELARLPLDPRVGRMILAARDHHALKEVLIIASALSVQDPRDRPIEAQEQADQAHRQFVDERSEFLQWTRIWKWFEEAVAHKKSNRQLTDACRAVFLSHLRLREWRDVHSQLLTVVREHGWRLNESDATFEQVHLSLLTGLLGNVGLKADDEPHYLGARGIKFHLWPGSALLKKAGRWVMAGELVETSRLYARTIAKIEPEWLEIVGGHLLKKSLSDAHWEKKAAQVVAFERAVLYGLTVYARRRVSFGQQDQKYARELFIRGALVEGEFDTRLPFFAHNRKLVADIEQLEHKSRRQDVLVDDELIHAFYDALLPEGMWTGAAFERWYRDEQKKPGNEKLLFLSRDDLMRHEAAGVTTDLFPKRMTMSGIEMALTYHFEPGSPRDGVTLAVPLYGLNQVDARRVEWLVPGMIKEKAQLLLKSLPQKLRRHVVPLPDYAAGFAQRHAGPAFGAGGLVESLIADIRGETQVAVKSADFKLETLPAHLFMNFKVIDEHGRQLAMGRNLAQLRAELGGQAQQQFQKLTSAAASEALDALSGESGAPVTPAAGVGASAGTALYENLTTWNFGKLPELLEIRRRGQTLFGYPALVDRTTHCDVEVFDSPEEAARIHRAGLRRLFALQLREPIRYLEKNLPGLREMSLHFMALGTADELRDQIVGTALDRACLQDPLPDDDASFHARRDAAKGRLTLLAQEIARLVGTILTEYAALPKKLAQAKPFAQAYTDIQAQLSALIGKRFVIDTPYAQLAHFPRYLKAIALRIDKLKAEPARDARQFADLQPLAQHYQRAVSQRGGVADARLAEYRWLLEELRVSLFAQELRTPMPVSVKRLHKVWESMQR